MKCYLCQKELLTEATPSEYALLPMPDDMKNFHCPTKVVLTGHAGGNYSLSQSHYFRKQLHHKTDGYIEQLTALVLPFIIVWHANDKMVVVRTHSEHEQIYTFKDVPREELPQLYKRFKNLIAFS